MAPSILASSGAQAVKQSRYAPIHVTKAISGLVTNRFAFQDSSTEIFERFYGGHQDIILAGSNIEVSTRNTWVRRPGTSGYTTFQFPTPPLGSTSFNQNGTYTLYVDTATNIYTVTPTTGTSIFTKAAGAGQASYLQLGDTLFIGDGVDTIKIINGKVWNWGIVGPDTAPTVQVVASGSAAVSWQASTVFSTMGFIVDSNGNVQELVSVNADGSNSTNATVGTSGNGQPAWVLTPGTTTTESTGTPITWTNKGPIVAWTAHTTYNNATLGGTLANPCIIYDPTSLSCYVQANPGEAQGISGGTKPHFTGVFASIVHDNTVKWFCLGIPKAPPVWLPGTHYQDVANNLGAGAVSVPTTPAAAGIGGANPQLIFWMDAGFTGGTSGTGGTSPKWQALNTGVGTLTPDGQLGWLSLGTATWGASTTYFAWSQGPNFIFSAIKDTNSNMQVCITGGNSATLEPGTTAVLSAAANASAGNTTYTGTFSPPFLAGNPVTISGFTTPANNGTFTIVSCNATTLVVNNAAGVAEAAVGSAIFNPWNAVYGQNTVDGTVTWVCVGRAMSWAASTKWYLPLVGFFAPQPTDPYGGAEINDGSSGGAGDTEVVINSGKSFTSAPTWPAVGAQVTESSGPTWLNLGPGQTHSLVSAFGFGWAYAFKSRTATDFYVTNIPNGLTAPLGPPTGSGDGSISTASPVFKLPTGPNPGAVYNLSGEGSLDPQVDTIVIYRSVDGSQGGPYFELTEIPNPMPVNGMPGKWNFQDYIEDIDLNQLIEADVVGLNDPPLAGLTNLSYTQGRIFGSIGNIIYASSGADIAPDNGNGLTGFGPANNFPLNSPVEKTVALNNGILAFTTTDEWSILGGPSITQFFPSISRPGVGILTPNALATLGAEMVIFTADRRLLSFIPGAGETEPGEAIADQFASFDPAKVYVTLHENGTDKGIFLGDGSTGWFRCNLHQWPNNYAVWSPFATITGGCGMLQSVNTAAGVRSLLIGGTSNNEVLSQRDLTTNADSGTNYTANFTIGGIPLCSDGEVAELGFITATLKRVGTTPVVSYLLNEISGSFAQFASFVNDPPLLYGTTVVPSSVFRNRYYFKQTMSDGNPPPAGLWATDIQIKVGFIAENAANEMARFTLFAGLYKDPND